MTDKTTDKAKTAEKKAADKTHKAADKAGHAADPTKAAGKADKAMDKTADKADKTRTRPRQGDGNREEVSEGRMPRRAPVMPRGPAGSRRRASARSACRPRRPS